MTFAATSTVGDLHPELPGWTEQLAIAIAASGDAHDIRIDQGDRIGVEAPPGERQSVRWAKLLVVLAAALALGSASLLGAHRFLRPASVAPPPRAQGPNASAAILNSTKGPRLESHPKVVRATTARAPAAPNLRATPRIAHAKPSRPAVPPAMSASSYAPPAPPPASPAANVAQPPVETPLVPVPETRPTTIDGWVLRDVTNGTAVLEGPDGLWRVKRGDTLPGAGQVVDIFAWGNRMIVATSKGLITTP